MYAQKCRVRVSIAHILLAVTVLVLRQRQMVMNGRKHIANAVVITKDITNNSEMENRITPDFITSLKENEIFVFGCRRFGRHWEGAAAFALETFGAVFGQGEAPQGRSYAITTAGVGLTDVKAAVDRFTKYAMGHPEQHFLVTRIGCGLGGWRVPQIAPMFRDASSLNNVWLPKEFWDELNYCPP